MTGYGDDVAGLAMPLAGPADLDPLLDRAADARVVMIGEATHGTRDFYRWRDVLTRRLVAEQDVAFVAVEGDWPDCARLDACVRLQPGASADPGAVLSGFTRWPTWMWANEEVAAFADWLRRHNAARNPPDRVAFHGLDLYSLWDSLRAILRYLRRYAPGQVAAALAAYACFAPFDEDPQRYARSTRAVPESCEDEVVALLSDLRARAAARAAADADFDAWQNAEVVAGAERFYRAMVAGGRESWNVRDRHMDSTLARLCDRRGPHARAVVWAHNTHVGDARATDMARAGEVNIGQLARERYGADRVVLVGLGCHRGEVVAAPAWEAPMRRMAVPPARPGALEDVLHRHAPGRALLVFPRVGQPRLLTDRLGHRAIGVVYDPARERWGNYVPTELGARYDAFVWCDDTAAVRPLPTHPVPDLLPETYPTGV